MRSLISEFVLLAGHSRQRLPKFSDRSVSEMYRTRSGYFSHSLVCWSCVSWYTCSTESSACPSQDLPPPPPPPPVVVFRGFMEWVVGIYIFYNAEYALTCSTFCLVCTGGRSSMNLMVRVVLFLAIPSMTHCLIVRSVQFQHICLCQLQCS